MDNGTPVKSGLSRGDRRRNTKLERLRRAVPDGAAIVAIDLAEASQALGVFDRDHRVLARRTLRCGPWDLGAAIDWGRGVAAEAGFDSVTVACEPTGHRWKPIVELCRRRGVTLVCVQPLLVHRERERDDYTRDRSDPKDVTLIARLARERRCYLPQVPEPDWARLRHLGLRRDAKLSERTAARQRLRDLLGCYWPAALETARQPLRSTTLLACLLVSCDPSIVAALDYDTFAGRVAEQLPRVDGKRRNYRVMRAFHRAAVDDDGRRIGWEQAGAAERAAFALEDLLGAHTAVVEVEDRMVGLLDALGYLELATSIHGLSAVGAAAILAETGDPTAYDSGRAWAKHAGICPRDNRSGGFHGESKVSRRGRALLRTAAWRAIWGLLPHNQAFTDFYTRLTRRQHNPLRDGQARAACANKLLRQLWVVLTHRVAWNPAIATGQQPPPNLDRHPQEVAHAA